MRIFNIFSTKSINIISAIISVIIVFLLNLSITAYSKTENIEDKNIISEDITEENNNNNNENAKQKKEEKQYTWYIEIPSINLKAPIEETTNMKVLNKAVGHFEDTTKTKGNIGLAGHNRGYEKNYFKNLKTVKKGQEIKYKYYDFEKTYVVEKIKIIKDTDWSYLDKTKDNRITLITCIENKPKQRLCVQAIEINVE